MLEGKLPLDLHNPLVFLLICLIPPVASALIKQSPGKLLLSLQALTWDKEIVSTKTSFIRSIPWILIATSIGLSPMISNQTVAVLRSILMLLPIAYYALYKFYLINTPLLQSPIDRYTKSTVYELPKYK